MTNLTPMGITYKPLGRLFGLLSTGVVKLNPKQSIVLAVLVSQLDPTTNTAWIHQPTHAAISGMSVSTLKTTLNSLLKMGFIENTGGRESAAVVYGIKLDVIAAQTKGADSIEIAQPQAAHDVAYDWRIAAGLGGRAREAALAAQERAQ